MRESSLDPIVLRQLCLCHAPLMTLDTLLGANPCPLSTVRWAVRKIWGSRFGEHTQAISFSRNTSVDRMYTTPIAWIVPTRADAPPARCWMHHSGYSLR
jgi:hypothetical protein